MPFRISCRVWKALSWVPVAYMFNQHGYTMKLISGRSMQPTLNPEPCVWRDLVVLDRISVHVGKDRLKRGDVVSLESPTNPGSFSVKRIIGLPGDVIRTLPPYPLPEITVPGGHVWVEGDEPFWTMDSNFWGPVPAALVDARVVFILWPSDRFGRLPLRKIRDTAQGAEGLSNRSVPWKKQLSELERER